MILAEELRKSYNGIEAVKGLTLKIEEGEVFGLLGPNGAGKTTTIKMLTTLTEPTSGRAFVAGYEIRENPLEVKRVIGLAPQHINLDNELTAYENLDFHGRLYHMPERERKRRIDELLSVVELSQRAHDLVETFSGGMKRRLLIARALMHKPKVLFLDEPTVGLDAQTRRRIWDLIRKLSSERITIFLTTHYIEEAEMLCERVGVINDGRLIALGSPDELKLRLGKVVVEIFQDGSTIRKFFETREEAREYASEVCKNCNFMVRETNLEDIFIELTGRKIK